MPELPEVQTVVNHLAKTIKGKIFSDAKVLAKKMASPQLGAKIKNKKIKDVLRIGKMIAFKLSGRMYLLVHLKMTGQLIFVDLKGRSSGGGHPINFKSFNIAEPNRFTRVILNFMGGERLLFHDIRKFGWIRLSDEKGFLSAAAKYGPDPLMPEFTLKFFQNAFFASPKAKIKQLLMRQDKISGIGNIYADESLFLAGILPGRAVAGLTAEETKKLHAAIKSVLKRAIKLGGTSVNTFLHPTGDRGKFAEKLNVYKRGNLPCVKCGYPLSKTKIGGRGTVYCQNCQK